jgi:hypothetical protein
MAVRLDRHAGVRLADVPALEARQRSANLLTLLVAGVFPGVIGAFSNGWKNSFFPISGGFFTALAFWLVLTWPPRIALSRWRSE